MKKEKELDAMQEEANEEIKTEELGVRLTDEEMAQVNGGKNELPGNVTETGKTLITASYDEPIK